MGSGPLGQTEIHFSTIAIETVSMGFESLRRAIYGPPAVQWCGDLYAESPEFRLAIDDLRPDTIQHLAESAETKTEFHELILDEWAK